MACDGIWDVIGDDEAVELILTILEEKVTTTFTCIACHDRYKDCKQAMLMALCRLALPKNNILSS